MGFLASSDGANFLSLLIFPVLIAVAIGSYLWRKSRAEKMLFGWAAQNALRLIAYERRSFLRGPFFWTSGRSRVVYRVTVQLPDGCILNCWVRCGGWFLGMLSDNVDVRWDAQPPTTGGFPVIMPGNPPQRLPVIPLPHQDNHHATQ